jgi:2-C-methyl-D-erythritol 4-phosphate cytidylyltransferase/2-C-methyl-D-erythritol 2,4-cyclodiphosphate synthase
MPNAVVILAAGTGKRAGGPTPKQFQMLAGKPLLRHTLEAFAGHPDIHRIQVVIAMGDEKTYQSAAAGLTLNPPVIGGPTRQQSGHLGLEAIAGDSPHNVLIHDAARPFVSPALISQVVSRLEKHIAVIPAMPISETLKRAPDGVVSGTVEREHLWAAQTPQGFRYELIRDAHARAARAGLVNFTDDAAIAEWAGMKVVVCPGESTNRKLTTPEDIRLAEEDLVRNSLRCPDVRVGQGFDVHPFEPGEGIILCGIRIAHHAKLKGHSDADAPMHALTDALLGSIGEGDIGTHFPPTDERWKNAASSIFLKHAVGLISARGGYIANADITIICETPKIAPHIALMRNCLADLMRISSDRVAIKATTSEGMGFTGRKEGLAAFATVTVRLP